MCFLVNATTRPPGLGHQQAHWLAWDSRIRVQYPVSKLAGTQSEIETLVNLPLTLVLTAPFVGSEVYPLAGDLVRLVPRSDGNCTLATNSSYGGLVAANEDGNFVLPLRLMEPALYTICHAFANWRPISLSRIEDYPG